MTSALHPSLQSIWRCFLSGDAEGAEQALARCEAPQEERDLLAVRLLRDRGRHQASLELGERAVEATEGGPLHARALVELGATCIGVGQGPRAEQLLRRGRDLARAQGDEATWGEAHHRLARLAYMRGDTAEGLRQLALALELLERAGEDDARAEALFHRAAHRGRQGQLDDADADAAEALRMFQAQGNRRGEMRALQVLGGLALPRRDFERAERQLSQATEMALSMGETFAAASCRMNLAEVHRLHDRFEPARALYEQALAVFEVGAPSYTVVTRFNLALVDLGLGDFEGAERRLRELEGTDAASHGQGAFFHVPLSACAAAKGDLEAWDHHDHHARTRIDEHHIVEPDLAWAARLSAELLERGEAGPAELSRAARARELALTQLEALQRAPEVQAERDALRRLASQGSPIPLGPFDLRRPIGAGGMAEVWEGQLRATGEAVAVKVLTEARAREPAQRADFAREVRAIARLDHPHIARVVGHGLVGAAAEVMTEGRLVRGSPYLAMELAQGTLRPWCGRLSWSVVSGILLDLLGALAHAHARGVVHRDLKPDNVLLLAPKTLGDPPPVRLADFGLARLGGADADHGRIMGTPAYMAPEQFRGLGRDQGPWTDLYALGAMAWRLVTGERVFEAEDIDALRAAHTWQAPPPLNARMPVPDGLEGWLGRLLAKSPWDRFRSAADAAWALQSLGEAMPLRAPLERDEPLTEETFDLGSMVTPSQPLASARTLRIGPSPEGAPTLRLDGLHALSAPPARVERALPSISVPPPLPERPGPSPSGEESLGAAVHLGLHGLRRLPLIGRDAEQQRLWDVLRHRRAAAVVLQGEAGVGKSRLATAFAERAEEEGGAVVLRVHHGRLGSSSDGLIPALARWLSCEGLSEQALWTRLNQRLRPRAHPGLVHALRELLLNPEELSEAETRATLASLMELLTRHRPAVLILEDAQWGARSLERALDMLQRSIPVILVVCVREGAPAEDPEALRALLAHPRAEALPLAPLSEASSRRLLEELLGGPVPLVPTLMDHARGNPLHAVQLVDDWLRRGLLVPRPEGLQLRAGAEPVLPADLPSLWTRRLEALLDGLSVGERQALELAALLGPQVQADEWDRARERLDLRGGEQALERLLQARLVTPERGEAWRFTHSMLQESLLETAEARGDLPKLHAAIAALGVPAEREAQHQLAAGRLEQALEPLLRAASRALQRGEPSRAARHLERHHEALAALEATPEDPRRAAAQALQERLAGRGGERRQRS
ncbi:MAG: protein kinase [Alphaproteobacteria bacterium]|nr:protein kinase [Alphaproteobacteria bacterium]